MFGLAEGKLSVQKVIRNSIISSEGEILLRGILRAKLSNYQFLKDNKIFS
jgi:hypothetical protein